MANACLQEVWLLSLQLPQLVNVYLLTLYLRYNLKRCLRNKKDEHGTTTKNKARLVTQVYSQEEEFDYDETFAPIARMEAIKIFLAFATYMNFKVYQMDVKSAFLNGKLKEEFYVKQPPGFESSEFPDYVCKLNKALYGLKQAPRACSLVKTLMVPPKNLGFDLKGYSDSDYACCNMDRKSTSSAYQILGGNTADVFDPFPSTDEPEKHILKEFLIKFSISNRQRPLTFGFKTFCLSTGLDCNNGKYVDHPTLEVLDRNYSSTKQVNSIQQLLAYSLITRTEVDIREIIYSDLGTCKSQPLPESTVTPLKDSRGNDQLLDKDLTFMTSDKARLKPRRVLKGYLGTKTQGKKPPADMEPLHTTESLIENDGEPSYEEEPDTQPMLLTYADVQAIFLSEDEAQESDEEVLVAGDDMDEDHQDDKETALKREIFSLRQETFKIKSIMTERYEAFQGRPSPAPSGSFTPTLDLTNNQANVERENATTTATEEPPSHSKGRLKNQDWEF
nr:retrovirus-related Pol polyprotein from transposon TNT 1-94 [Tanacetum cinerariifolium]GEX13435.1 retrovirus-related Pol polyprotein from transposon TNT 1-94 [Tanacetum cinerariifolium]